MYRRKQPRAGASKSPDQAKSTLDKLLFLHSNFIFSHIDSHNWKIATYSPCLKQKKNSHSLIKSFSSKKAHIGSSRPLSAICYRIPQISEQFMTVSKKTLVEKQHIPTKSARFTRFTKKPQQKQKQNGQINGFELYESIIAKQKICPNLKLFRDSKKWNTETNESSQQNNPKQSKLIKRKKKITDPFELSRESVKKTRPQTTHFKNLQLRKAILNDDIGISKVEKGLNSENEFNAWKVQVCDTSQF